MAKTIRFYRKPFSGERELRGADTQKYIRKSLIKIKIILFPMILIKSLIKY